MSTEALVTVLALGVSVYALLPMEKRLELRLRVGWLFFVSAVASGLLVHYIKYQPVLSAMGIAPDLGPWRYGFTPELASYLALTLGVALCWTAISLGSLKPRRIDAFEEFNNELLFDAKYPALLFLWKRHLGGLKRLLESRHLFTRLRKRLIGDDRLSIEWRWEDGPDEQRTLVTTAGTLRIGRLLGIRRTLARLVPDYEDERSAAERICERVFFSKPLIEHLASNQPYFALELLTITAGFPREEFLREYFRQLLSKPSSVFFEELRFSLNYSESERYRIEKHNRLMYFFFGEDFWAERLEIYRPFGNHVVNLLESRRIDVATDVYAEPMGRYYEEGRWTCPFFGAIALFDLMIIEGLHRGGRSHLWLFYVQYFVEEIVANIEAAGGTKRYGIAEFPSPYHYLLYEAISTQCRWIREAAGLKGPLDSLVIDDTRLTPGSLTKSALVSLGSTLHWILSSTVISAEFKASMLEVVLRTYSDVATRTGRREFVELFRNSVIRGGDREDIGPAAYRAGLTAAYDGADLVPYRMGGNETLVDEIAAAIGR